MLAPTKINGEQYLTHQQIAKWVYHKSVKLHGSPVAEPSFVIEALTSEIKELLIAAHVVPNASPSVVRRGFDMYADRTAFFALAQHYDWDEEITQPVLTALGEYGEIRAQQLINELTNKEEEAA